eukprot:scaffold155_cov347-Pavlova_lutheri.AAC.34
MQGSSEDHFRRAVPGVDVSFRRIGDTRTGSSDRSKAVEARTKTRRGPFDSPSYVSSSARFVPNRLEGACGSIPRTNGATAVADRHPVVRFDRLVVILPYACPGAPQTAPSAASSSKNRWGLGYSVEPRGPSDGVGFAILS